MKELFCPEDHDNKDSTKVLEKIAIFGAEAFISELLDEKKATYKYLSISGTEYSYEHCPDEVKKALLGCMATNDMAESSFAGVTAQLQCYGCIGMHNGTAVSDMKQNGFMS